MDGLDGEGEGVMSRISNINKKRSRSEKQVLRGTILELTNKRTNARTLADKFDMWRWIRALKKRKTHNFTIHHDKFLDAG